MDLRRSSSVKPQERWIQMLDAFLLSYSQIFFARDRWVGALMFAATLSHPILFLGGGITVLMTNFFARLLHLSNEEIKLGMYGYNGLLVGLALFYFFEANPPLLVILVLAIFTTVLITAALRASLGYYLNLPVLTLPFLLTIFPVLAAAPSIRGMNPRVHDAMPSFFQLSFPDVMIGYLKSLGAILFMPDVAAGFILLVALLFFSRIALFLSLVGFGIAIFWFHWMFDFPQGNLYSSVGFNFVLISIAMGGIWFVPQKSSFLLAISSVLFCALLWTGATPLFSSLGLPVLILPFNLTLLTFLFGMRQRTMDGTPKSVMDFESSGPESNLLHYQTRIMRFSSHFDFPISLPFLGIWTCIQGVSGPFTHRGFWEHGFDFEVKDHSGSPNKNAGLEISDYFAYKLPVLACADGQIVRVVHHLPDNPAGAPDLKENWGNLVMIQHSPSLFSLVCHLTPHPPKFKEGDFVRRGDIIGFCGNSGRSATPHLHFHFQNTPRVGSPTIHSEFHEVVLEGEHPRLLNVYVPREGDRIRNIRKDQEIADRFIFPVGQNFLFKCYSEDKQWHEEVESVMDLYGRLKLISPIRKTQIHFEYKNSVFTIFDFEGQVDSVLFVLYASAPRVPYESVVNLSFEDRLSARHFLPLIQKILSDLLAPFFNRKGVNLTYGCELRGSDFIVSGKSSPENPSSYPPIETRAIFQEGRGWIGGYLIVGRKRLQVVRLDNRNSNPSGGRL